MTTLEEAFKKVEKFCKDFQVSQNIEYKIRLVTEELVVNILKYAKTQEYNLFLTYKKEGLYVEINYKDDSFDPTCFLKEDKDVNEMRFGGLGLFLVNNISKNVKYDYIGGRNIVKIEL